MTHEEHGVECSCICPLQFAYLTCLFESALARFLASESTPQKGCSGLYMPSASRFLASSLDGCCDSVCLIWLAAASSASMTNLTLHSGRAGTPFKGADPGGVAMSCPLGMAFWAAGVSPLADGRCPLAEGVWPFAVGSSGGAEAVPAA